MGQVDEVFYGYDLFDPQLEVDLSHSITRWLDRRELSKLYFYLYRIDVNEALVQEILESHDLNQSKATQIARLMIKRQIKKLENRS